MEAPQGGFFLSAKKPYAKPALAVADQITLLKSRGLAIDDEEKAAHYLTYIGYFRLVGYARHFRSDRSNPEKYDRGASFADVLNLYVFDRKVRLLLFDGIERVEVAVRAAMSNVGALKGGGPFWLCNANNFDYGQHGSVMSEITTVIGNPNDPHHQHKFITHFYSNYSDSYPPGWMLMECLSFGASSRIYKLMKGALRIEIADKFKLQHDIAASWLHSLSYGRNISAHHSRCWKRIFTIRPMVPKAYKTSIPAGSDGKLYMQFWMIQHFLKSIADGSEWAKRLKALIDDKPKTSLSDMGFPDTWEQDPFWAF
jgi:abortive infection bacteriophage resistance protein